MTGETRTRTCIVAAVTIALLFSLSGERIPVNDGLGYDGAAYGAMVLHLESIRALDFDAYLMTRIFPAILVRGLLGLTGAPLEPGAVVNGFLVYNTTLVLLALPLWWRISCLLSLPFQATWIGGVALVCNFPVLKLIPYYPVLTDPTAFFFSLAQVWLYLERRPGWLMAVTLPAAFTWPTLLYQGLVLFLYPSDGSRETPRKRFLRLLVAILAGVGVMILAISFVFAGYFKPQATSLPSLLPLSAVGIGLYVFCTVLWALPPGILLSPSLLKRPGLRRWLTAALVIAGVRVIQVILVSERAGGQFSLEAAVSGFMFLVLQRPGEFLVAHALFFGPSVLLLTRCYRRLGMCIEPLGPGFGLALTLNLLLAALPTSRQSIALLPFLAVAVAVLLRDAQLPRGFLTVFAAVSLLASRAWLLLNRDFDTLYFMCFGGYFSNTVYAAYAVLTVLGLVWLGGAPWTANQEA